MNKLFFLLTFLLVSSVSLAIPAYSEKDFLIRLLEEDNVRGIKRWMNQPKIDINVKFQKGYTPLHLAAWLGSFEAVKLIMSHPSVDVNVKSDNDEIPLDLALVMNNPSAAKALLTANDKLKISPMSDILFLAIFHKMNDVALTLIKRQDINVNTQKSIKYSPITESIQSFQNDIVKALLNRADFDVNRKNDGMLPIHAAIHANNEEALEMLVLHPKIDVNESNFATLTPLVSAISSKNLRMVNALLSHPDIDVNKCAGPEKNLCPIAIAAALLPDDRFFDVLADREDLIIPDEYKF